MCLWLWLKELPLTPLKSISLWKRFKGANSAFQWGRETSLSSLPQLPLYLSLWFLWYFYWFVVYFWLCWVFITAHRLSYWSEQGLLSRCGVQASRCGGFSLQSTGSRHEVSVVTMPGLSTCSLPALKPSSVVVAHGLRCSTACKSMLAPGHVLTLEPDMTSFGPCFLLWDLVQIISSVWSCSISGPQFSHLASEKNKNASSLSDWLSSFFCFFVFCTQSKNEFSLVIVYLAISIIDSVPDVFLLTGVLVSLCWLMDYPKPL